MKIFLIEVLNRENAWVSEIDGRLFWSGAASNTKLPKIYQRHHHAEQVLKSTNTYIPAGSRIIEAELILTSTKES